MNRLTRLLFLLSVQSGASGCVLRSAYAAGDPLAIRAAVRGDMTAEVELNPRATDVLIPPVCVHPVGVSNATRSALLELAVLNAVAARGYPANDGAAGCGSHIAVTPAIDVETKVVPGKVFTQSSQGGSAVVLPIGGAAIGVGNAEATSDTTVVPAQERRAAIARVGLVATSADGTELWRARAAAPDFSGPEVVVLEHLVASIARRLPGDGNATGWLWRELGLQIEVVSLDGVVFSGVVTNVRVDSPASRAKFGRWDLIQSIDGQGFTGRTLPEYERWLRNVIRPRAAFDIYVYPGLPHATLRWPEKP